MSAPSCLTIKKGFGTDMSAILVVGVRILKLLSRCREADRRFKISLSRMARLKRSCKRISAQIRLCTGV